MNEVLTWLFNGYYRLAHVRRYCSRRSHCQHSRPGWIPKSHLRLHYNLYRDNSINQSPSQVSCHNKSPNFLPSWTLRLINTQCSTSGGHVWSPLWRGSRTWPIRRQQPKIPPNCSSYLHCGTDRGLGRYFPVIWQNHGVPGIFLVLYHLHHIPTCILFEDLWQGDKSTWAYLRLVFADHVLHPGGCWNCLGISAAGVDFWILDGTWNIAHPLFKMIAKLFLVCPGFNISFLNDFFKVVAPLWFQSW